VIAVASRDASDVALTKKALEIDFPLVPGPNFPIQKSYGVFNDRTLPRTRPGRPAVGRNDSRAAVEASALGERG